MKKNYPTLLLSLLSLAMAPSAVSAQSDTQIIKNPPAGKVYNLYRQTTGYESFFYNAMPHESDGDWSRMVVTNEGEIYVENPINAFFTNSWMKGYKAEGDTLCFDFPQPIYEEQGYGDEPEYGYLFRMKQTEDGRNYQVDSVGQTMKYVFRNDSLIKVDDDLLGVCMKNGSWVSYGELTSVSRVGNEPDVKPALSESVRDGMMLYMSGTSARQYPVKWAVEGNDVYIGNLTTNLQGFWIKGELQNGVAYFPSCQMIGIDTITRTYVYAMNATLTEQEDPYSGTYYEPSFLDEPMDFDYNEAEGTLFFRGTLVVNKGMNKMLPSTAFDIYQHPQISPWEDHPGQPYPPIFTNYMPYGPSPYGGSDGGIEFKFSYYDVDGNYLNPLKLFYNIYFDNELYTFTPDEYTDLTGNMTDVPFSYKDRDFEHVDDNTRRIYFYKDYRHFGAESFYIDGDTRIGSGITTYDADSDVDGISHSWADKKIESVSYTDLAGRKLDHPAAKGVSLRTIQYSDGTVRTQKVVLKAQR